MLDKQYFLRWVGLLAEWNQFNLTASAASMYMGGVSVVARSGGTLRETIGPGANLACYYATKYDTRVQDVCRPPLRAAPRLPPLPGQDGGERRRVLLRSQYG